MSPGAVPARPPSTGFGGSGGGGRHRDSSDASSWAIGYAGEVAANEWLRRKYGPDRVRWRSTYRDDHLGGEEGDNSLGYDFEVADQRGLIVYEVKATSGTSTAFELPPVEYRCALQHAANDRYRILFITEVLDGEKMRAFEVPSPLGEHASFFTLMDSAVRFGFQLPEDR